MAGEIPPQFLKNVKGKKTEDEGKGDMPMKKGDMPMKKGAKKGKGC